MRREGRLYAWVAGYFLLVLAPSYFFFGRNMQITQTWAVIVTGAAIVWYTWETRVLRETASRQADVGLRQVEATLRQTEVQLRPFVIFDPTNLTIINHGNGAALHVAIDDVATFRGATWEVVIRFPEPIPLLGHGDTVSVKACLSDGSDVERGTLLLAIFDHVFSGGGLSVVCAIKTLS